VVGANKPDTHLRGVVPGTHFQAEYADLREADPGDACAKCGAPLAVERVIEIGNIFRLGTKYSVPLGALYLDEQGQEQPIVMGSYGIGPARIAAAAIEQNHDKDGMIWPESIAPFDVHLLVVNVKDAKMAGGRGVPRSDRRPGGPVRRPDERGGVKFKDADLLGSLRLRSGAGPERRRGGSAPPADGRGHHSRPGGSPRHVRGLLGRPT
jgi:prolyl-tRNA synthetase